jgi:hypothetical protein
MSVTRQNIATYLDSQFSTLASAIGQDDEPIFGYKIDIDLALRKLGKTRSELADATVEDSQEEAAFALAKYYALDRLFSQFGALINIKVDDSQFDYKQAQVNVGAMRDKAAQVCASLGYDTAASGWGIGWLNLDWLEAEAEGI